MMSQQAEQEQALKSDIAQESAENCTEEELSAITGGGKDNQAGQGAKTGAVVGAWMGGGYLGYQGAKLGVEAVREKPCSGKQAAATIAMGTVMGGVVGAVGGAGLGAAIGGSVGATFPARRN